MTTFQSNNNETLRLLQIADYYNKKCGEYVAMAERNSKKLDIFTRENDEAIALLEQEAKDAGV